MSAQPAFELPERLEAHAPPEARGLARDDVRMLVARGDGRLVHARARELADFLGPGDLVVINTSATLPAALAARRTDGTALELRLSTPLPGAADDRWVVELRAGAEPFRGGRAGDVLELARGGRATLETPYLTGARLWAARLELPEPLHGLPRPPRGADPLPLRARRAPAVGLRDRLRDRARLRRDAERRAPGDARGAHRAGGARASSSRRSSCTPASPRPSAASARIPSASACRPTTARLVEATRGWGGRVVAIGTTVVRALETVAGADGGIEAGEGWTALVVTPARGVRVVDGLLTGWHEPEASHLDMLEAIAGRALVERSYAAALQAGYLWHEFGDVHLILP